MAHQVVEFSVQNRIHVTFFYAGTVIFDQAIGLQGIRSNLATEIYCIFRLVLGCKVYVRIWLPKFIASFDWY